MPSPATRLALAHGAVHGADQAALAALPLVGALFLGLEGADLALLAAAQGAAWLLFSLPAGSLADLGPRRSAIRNGLLLAGLGFLLAAPAALGGAPWLAAAIFLGTGGLALHAVAAFSYLPHVASGGALVGANARLGLTRALATLAAPPLAAAAVAWGASAPFVLAALLAVLALALALSLPADPAPAPTPGGWREGVALAARTPVFRAILLVSTAWNVGLFALLAALVPLALERGLDAAAMAAAAGAYGAGLAIGALLAAPLARRLTPRAVMILGPLSGLPAVPLLWALPGPAAAAAALLLLGAGAILWQAMQTALRQALSPPGSLGRLTGVFQLASFGVRPLGALAGAAGLWAAGADGALAAAAAAFVAAVAAFLLSPLSRLRRLPIRSAA